MTWIGYTYPEDLPEGEENQLPGEDILVWVFDAAEGKTVLAWWIDFAGGWWSNMYRDDELDSVAAWHPLIEPPPPV